MQEEVPKEQAWQGGIRFERTCKDFEHSVMLCMCSSFLLLYLVCFCLSLEWLNKCSHLNILEFAGRGQRDRVWRCTLHRPGFVHARIVFEE